MGALLLSSLFSLSPSFDLPMTPSDLPSRSSLEEMPFPSLFSSLLPPPPRYQDHDPPTISFPLSQMSSRRRSEPKKTDTGRVLEPIRWVPYRQAAGRDVERNAGTHEKRENHHNSQSGRQSLDPSILRRDSAYSSEEEAERTRFPLSHGQNEYANVPVRETGRRMTEAEEAAAWDDPALEVDVDFDFSMDDEDDVKPIGDRIPTRNDRSSLWDLPLSVHLRSLITRRPSILSRSTTILKDRGNF